MTRTDTAVIGGSESYDGEWPETVNPWARTGLQRLPSVAAVPTSHGFFPAAVIRVHEPWPIRRPVS